MSKSVDQFILVLDLEGFGYSNIDLKQIKTLVPVLSDNYSEALHTMFLIKGGYLFKAIYAAIKPFIYEETK